MSKFKINPNDIKPAKKGKADFFSWNVYQWVKKYPSQCEIWLSVWDSVDGFRKEPTNPHIGFMGEDGWFHGRQLKTLCVGRSKTDSYAYGPNFRTERWKEVTEDWWKKYLEIGVCAIHEDIAHSWIESDSKRTCRYCKKAERKEVFEETVTRVRWVTA